MGIPEHTFRTAFDEAPIGMAVLTVDGTVLGTNEALQGLLGRAAADLEGRTLFELTHPDDLALARSNCQAMTNGLRRVVRHESRLLQPSGAVVWVLISTSRAARGEPHLIMHVEDISERKQLEEELVRRAVHDPLTGLPNRVLLLDRLDHALERSRRAATPTCLLYLDLNGFKTVNDTYGHAAGDAVLYELAHRITGIVRSSDTAARLGGDEFAVLCEDTTHEQAVLLAARLRSAARRPFDIRRARTVTLSAAVGVGVTDGRSRAGEEDVARALLACADRRMYEDKSGTPWWRGLSRRWAALLG